MSKSASIDDIAAYNSRVTPHCLRDCCANTGNKPAPFGFDLELRVRVCGAAQRHPSAIEIEAAYPLFGLYRAKGSNGVTLLVLRISQDLQESSSSEEAHGWQSQHA